jgi:hypothetical protein
MTERLRLVTVILLIVALAVPFLSCASESVPDTGWRSPSAYAPDTTDARDNNNDASMYTSVPEVSEGTNNDYDLLVDSVDGNFTSVQIQLALVLDGSSSITPSSWAIMLGGLAAAVRETSCIPHDGTVELTVIKFDTNAFLEVGPVVITDANAEDVALEITNISKAPGTVYTCISCGLCLAADTLYNSPCFNASIKQAINLITDGVPNRCSCYSGGGCGYVNSGCTGTNGELSARCARYYLLTKLGMMAGQDELDAEFLGVQGSVSDWLKNEIVWPEQADGNGYYVPPFDKGPGWVRVVADAQQFADTLCEKMGMLIPSPPPVPEPQPQPEQPQPSPSKHSWCLLCAKRVADLPH